MADLVVTTSRKMDAGRWAQAQEWAERLAAVLVLRSDRSLEDLTQEYEVAGVLVVGRERVTYHEPAHNLEYFFHPGMARRRLRNIQLGRGDPMITAMRLRPSDTVLDCTLGRATDATVASHMVGPVGRVVGIEKVPVISWLTIQGLQHYEIKDAATREAMRRVEAYCADYTEFLPAQAEGSFDVVYFDPVFDQPLAGSSGMIPLRQLASDEPVTPEALTQARRVARRYVVIKQRIGTALWKELPFHFEIVAGGSSRIEYGVLEG